MSRLSRGACILKIEGSLNSPLVCIGGQIRDASNHQQTRMVFPTLIACARFQPKLSLICGTMATGGGGGGGGGDKMYERLEYVAFYVFVTLTISKDRKHGNIRQTPLIK